MKPPLFHTLSGLRVPKMPDLPPPDPPPPIITATHEVAVDDVIEVMLLSEEKKWKRRTTEYVTYHSTMAALTTIITDYCPYIYYMVLHEPDLGYANRAPREFVVHFWNMYARDEDPDMSANLERMMILDTMPKPV